MSIKKGIHLASLVLLGLLAAAEAVAIIIALPKAPAEPAVSVP